MVEQSHASAAMPPDRPFRILQVTDFHSDVAEDLNERTRQAIRDMAAHFAPDFIAATGDLWCGDEHPDAAPMWMKRDLEFLGSLGLPWAMCLGNHDYCDPLDKTLAQIAATPNAIMPPGDGKGAFRIELGIPGEALPAWDLFFLNSGPSWRPAQDLTWLTQETKRLNASRDEKVPAVCYFHIPTGNYQAAIDTGRTVGVGNEYVLDWGDDDGLAAKAIKEAGRQNEDMGNVRLCFSGHSHLNDFHFEEDGVVFAYTRATGYGGYGIEDLPKGATLLELDPRSGTFRFRTVFPDGTTWSHRDPPKRISSGQ